MWRVLRRHYILNFLWISVNVICILLTVYHLVKLYRLVNTAKLHILMDISGYNVFHDIHCKKSLSFFLSPAGMSLTNSPWPGII